MNEKFTYYYDNEKNSRKQNLSFLKSTDPTKRFKAIRFFIDNENNDTISILSPFLMDKDEIVRLEIVKYFILKNNPVFTRILAKLIQDKSEKIRSLLLDFFSNLKPFLYYELVASCLEDKKKKIRKKALLILKEKKPDKIKDILFKLQSSKDEDIRYETLENLMSLKLTKLNKLRVLKKAMSDNSEKIILSSLFKAKHLSQDLIDDIIKLVFKNKTSDDLKKKIIPILLKFSSPKITDTFNKLTKSNNDEIRHEAFKFIINDPNFSSNQNIIIRALKDNNIDIRKFTLNKVKEMNLPNIKNIMENFLSDDNPEIKMMALTFLEENSKEEKVDNKKTHPKKNKKKLLFLIPIFLLISLFLLFIIIKNSTKQQQYPEYWDTLAKKVIRHIKFYPSNIKQNSINNSFEESINSVGDSLFDHKFYKDAIQYYNIALDNLQNSSNKESFESDLVSALIEVQKYNEAEAIALNLIEIDPSSSSYWNNLGCIKIGLGDTTGAREAFENAVRLQSENSIAISNLNMLKILIDEKTNIPLKNTSPLMVALSIEELRNRNLQSTIEILKDAIEQNPFDDRSFKAYIYLTSVDSLSSLVNFEIEEIYNKLAEGDINGYLNEISLSSKDISLIETYDSLEQYFNEDSLLNYLMDYSYNNPSSYSSQFFIAQKEKELGNLENSYSSLDKAGELNPQNSEIILEKANVSLLLGEFERAKEEYEKTLESDINNPEAMAGLSLIDNSDTSFDNQLLNNQDFYQGAALNTSLRNIYSNPDLSESLLENINSTSAEIEMIKACNKFIQGEFIAGNNLLEDAIFQDSLSALSMARRIDLLNENPTHINFKELQTRYLQAFPNDRYAKENISEKLYNNAIEISEENGNKYTIQQLLQEAVYTDPLISKRIINNPILENYSNLIEMPNPFDKTLYEIENYYNTTAESLFDIETFDLQNNQNSLKRLNPALYETDLTINFNTNIVLDSSYNNFSDIKDLYNNTPLLISRLSAELGISPQALEGKIYQNKIILISSIPLPQSVKEEIENITINKYPEYIPMLTTGEALSLITSGKNLLKTLNPNKITLERINDSIEISPEFNKVELNFIKALLLLQQNDTTIATNILKDIYNSNTSQYNIVDEIQINPDLQLLSYLVLSSIGENIDYNIEFNEPENNYEKFEQAVILYSLALSKISNNKENSLKYYNQSILLLNKTIQNTEKFENKEKLLNIKENWINQFRKFF